MSSISVLTVLVPVYVGFHQQPAGISDTLLLLTQILDYICLTFNMVFSLAYLDCSKGTRVIPLYRGGGSTVALNISMSAGIDVIATPQNNNPINRKTAGPFYCL